jgi:hypothetical protein
MVADLRYRKYRGRIMALQGSVILLLIISLFVGLRYPIVGLTAGITFSGVSILYLLTPFVSRQGKIWGASKWSDLVEEYQEGPFYDAEEMDEDDYEVR